MIQELKERVAYLEAEVRPGGAVLGGARGLLRARTLSLKPLGVRGFARLRVVAGLPRGDEPFLCAAAGFAQESVPSAAPGAVRALCAGAVLPRAAGAAVSSS